MEPSMQQIADWLESLGMSEYAQRFAENGISIVALRYLTDQDLKDMGVLLGHRRIMLAAISELAAPTPVRAPKADPKTQGTAAPAPTPTAATPSAVIEAAGERRYLTVMFCDLVGSTSMSAQLDAEEWRDLVSSYLEAASTAVTDMGGHVLKKLGDGVMALFGYPVAHENDAERAARAALATQRALAELNRRNAGTGKPELIARIGLETGPAVLDATGEIYGDVANIAARVQALAESGEVLVTARVQRQIAGLFVVEECGTHALKGVPEPTVLFRLVRASGGGRHSGQRQLTPLVGRDEEMAMLTRRWDRARAGDGQLVLIVGEPGLGKSRLIEEFRVRLREVPHTWVEWGCSQLLQNTPLHPIAEWGRQRFGAADVPGERRLAELENALAQVRLDPAENSALLAPLIDIPLSKERTPNFTPEELRRRQLAALTNWVMAGAKVQPVVLAVEDLHWADPTTLDVLRGMAERGALAPLYILATTRPELRPPWGMRSHHSTISLAPLDHAQVRDMVAELSARHALAKDVVEDVAARTGGVPLFVEEVTRLLLERGEQGGIEAIPPTLQQSLMARLDRLGAAREVAQIGSVIGRGFSYALLRAVASIEDGALQAALEKLADADIVLVQGLPPDSDYRFKHALIQDAAYENLLKSRRQVLHRRVAEILRDHFADTSEPEVLGHHFMQAGLTDAAIEWWGKAGDQALRRSAFQEAISHLRKAIEMADKAAVAAPGSSVANADSTSIQRLKLQTSYGQALLWSRGFGAVETKAAFSRAKELATDPAAAERFPAYYGLWIGSLLRGELALAREAAEIFLREASNEARITEVAVASRALGMTCLLGGNFLEAQTHLERTLEIYDPKRDREVKFQFGWDSSAGAPSILALTNWFLGEVGRGRELMDEAIARAVESVHEPTVANTYFLKALFEMLCGDAAAARNGAETVVELGRKLELPLMVLGGALCSAWARARLDGGDGGTRELREAIAAFTNQGNRAYLTLFHGELAALEAEREGVEGALTRIDEALALASETGEHWSDALLYRIRGEILWKSDPDNAAPAEQAFLTAIAIARQQKARSFELRAVLSLAKLYQSIGRAADAHAVLAPALAGFRPTPELPEIAEAQALLGTLTQDDRVREALGRRQARAKLQVDYARAVQWGKGFAAEETRAAFERAGELAAVAPGNSEYWALMYGRFTSPLMRGEFVAALEVAETYLRQAQVAGRPDHVVNARRLLGTVKLELGAFHDSREEFEALLANWDEERDRALRAVTGADVLCVGRAYMAHTLVYLGEAETAVRMSEDAIRRAEALDDFGARAFALTCYSGINAVRGRPDAMREPAEALHKLAREKATPLWELNARGYASWARGLLQHDPAAAADDVQEIIAAKLERQELMAIYHWQGMLAELQNAAGAFDDALASIASGLKFADQTGGHRTDSFLHRVRGDILVKRDLTAAQAAYREALRIARQQGARALELQAAHALAKLYQSTNRGADAHAVLITALEGFSPTPEFPEIEEAQALLTAVAV
jgi:class 3 adenylate cyclase/tetratricopeptide (TPR) repeat protein